MKSVAKKSKSVAPFNLASYRCQVMASQPHPLKCLDSLAVPTTYHRGQEVCGECRPAEHWYCVITGAARRCAQRADGRRQIVGLLLPGDFFGFTAGNEYEFTVEAVVEGTVVAGYPRRRAELLVDSSPEIARELRQVVFETITRLQAQLLMLGRITAIEKVGSFLLDMARRSAPGRDDSVALPVSRYDIADYLAVSVETVSRSLTDLKQRGVIKFSGTRTLKIVDPNALKEGDAEGPLDRPSNTIHFSAGRRLA
jgi:CRP/FNR family transcriptional regulator, nitrogen fixation regulation protein